jgi:hypothetical protein
MTTGSDRTCYTTLNQDSRDIRLLQLLPGSKITPIQCRLLKVSLDNHPVYETISYAWGSPDDVRSINVDGKSMDIPANLESAFQQLRDANTSITLWADSVCIH